MISNLDNVTIPLKFDDDPVKHFQYMQNIITKLSEFLNLYGFNNNSCFIIDITKKLTNDVYLEYPYYKRDDVEIILDYERSFHIGFDQEIFVILGINDTDLEDDIHTWARYVTFRITRNNNIYIDTTITVYPSKNDEPNKINYDIIAPKNILNDLLNVV